MGIPSRPPQSFVLVLRGMPEVTWLILLLSASEFSSPVGNCSWRVVLGLSPVLLSPVLWVWVGWVDGEKVLGTGRMFLGIQGGCFWWSLLKKISIQARKALPFHHCAGRHNKALGAPLGIGSHLCTPGEVPAPVLGCYSRVRSLMRA